MKRCKVCDVERSLNEFYVHNTNKDGLQNECKNCYRKIRRKYDRSYSKQAEVRKRKLAHKSEWRDKNKHKVKAHRRLAYALSTGVLTKPDQCSRCGKKGLIHGHHDDYTRPLIVVWVCPLCHSDIHRNQRENRERRTQ